MIPSFASWAVMALVSTPAVASEWKTLTPTWSYAPATVQEETVTPSQGERSKRLQAWLKQSDSDMTVQVYALCETRKYGVVRLKQADGKIVGGFDSPLDVPPGDSLYPLIEAIDQLCRVRRSWWRF